jgi:hypothetical protein
MSTTTQTSKPKGFTSSLFIEDVKINKNENYHVLRLVKYGFSTKAIARRTGLSASQISYRVRLFNLQGMRAQYRNGDTLISQKVMDNAIKTRVKDAEAEAKEYDAIRFSILTALRKKK